MCSQCLFTNNLEWRQNTKWIDVHHMCGQYPWANNLKHTKNKEGRSTLPMVSITDAFSQCPSDLECRKIQERQEVHQTQFLLLMITDDQQGVPKKHFCLGSFVHDAWTCNLSFEQMKNISEISPPSMVSTRFSIPHPTWIYPIHPILPIQIAPSKMPFLLRNQCLCESIQKH